tara:strand:+ start:2083 stop:2721 length:639 start_codon:yes stop_codon:yes gene_type:complete
MTDYSKVTNFTAKDSLSSGDPNKIINGSLFDAEFDPISTAIASKINKVAGETGEIPKFTSGGQLESSGFTPANISFVSGTVMSFFQASAPTGWTQITTHNDKILRVVSTAGGGSGGTDSPISYTGTHTHTTAGHTLTIAEMPAHTHPTQVISGTNTDAGNYIRANDAGSLRSGNESNSTTTGGGGSHNHGATDSGGSTFTPKYINMIIASKN